ncbi:MAG: cation transporter [Lachnospiraceae bacterium]|nr:cation transporter [Lachnospiraceae bacterium]
MITLLSRLFIKNREQMENQEVRRAYGMLCSIVGIGLNVLLFIGKYVAGVLSGSIAITADAFNNLSDAGSSVITLVGFKFSGMKPDKDHPFGHGRIEYLSGLGVAMLIILMGFELFKSSVGKILHPEPVEAGIVPVVILLVSIGVKLYMGFYNRSIGKKIESEAMKATSTDSLSDSVATSAVLISMLASHTTGIQIDGWCGCVVAALVLFAGYNAAKDTLNPLLGGPPSKEFVKEIRNIVMSHPEIIGIHDLVVHDYGPGRRMVSLHGEVPANGDIIALHDLIDHIEKELEEKLGCEAVIHMDPLETDNEKITEMKHELLTYINSELPGVSIHDFRMVQGPTHTNLIFDAVVPYGFSMTNEEVQEALEKLVLKHWEKCFAVVHVEQSYI